MTNLWCKIWNFFLNMFTDAIKLVAYALTTVGEILCKVLTDVGSAVGDVVESVFGGSNVLSWLVIGGLAYFLIPVFFESKDKAEESAERRRRSSANSSDGGGINV